MGEVPSLRRPHGRRDGRAGDRGGPDFLELEFEPEFLHNRDAEIRFVARGILDVAVGFVNAHKLRAFLELFFGGPELSG